MKKHIFLFIFIPVVLFSQNKVTIAVMDLDAFGIPETESKIITSRLRTDLFNTNKFIVLERDKMEEILSEQGLQLSGCTTNECIVEAGQLLGVKQIVAGNIGKIGNLITITLRLIDIESGRILRTATEDCECKIETFLVNSVKNVSEILTGNKVKDSTYFQNKTQEYESTNKSTEKNWKKFGLSRVEYESFYRSGLDIENWKLNITKYNSEKNNPILNLLLSGAVPGLGQLRNRSKRGYIYFGIEILAISFGLYTTTSEELNYDDLIGWSFSLNHTISAIDAGISTLYYNSSLKKKYKLSNNYPINNHYVNLFSLSKYF